MTRVSIWLACAMAALLAACAPGGGGGTKAPAASNRMKC